jgi:hypothetical protein
MTPQHTARRPSRAPPEDPALAKRLPRAFRPGRGARAFTAEELTGEADLEPSAEPTLREPQIPPPGTGGEWVVLDGEGRVVSHFADRSESDEPR